MVLLFRNATVLAEFPDKRLSLTTPPAAVSATCYLATSGRSALTHFNRPRARAEDAPRALAPGANVVTP
jgi:hypothetical protein